MLKDILSDYRVWLLGLASWAIPFVLAFLFFDQSGQLAIAQPLFKSLMVLIGGGTGVALLVAAFRWAEPTLNTGLIIGCLWLAINLLLDILVLVPMAGMTTSDYIQDIGLRYLLIPIVAAGMGYVGGRRA